MSRLAFSSIGLLLCTSALAGGNAPEGAQRSAEEDYLRKINFACGTELAIAYEGESLRKLNKDIGWDQTGGSNECNEPLRYLWYACKTEAGKAAVKAARLTKIVCKGTAGSTGSLTVAGGTVTIGRAFEEEKPFLRSRKQFEAALKLRLALPGDPPTLPPQAKRPLVDTVRDGSTGDPYYDREWSDLRQKPNPVTDTKTYCLVNGEKIDFTEHADDSFHHRRQDATVKCWKNGEPVIDLVLKQGRRSGYVTYWRDNGSSRESLRDEKRHGEQRQLENGKLKSLALYTDGERIWEKTYFPSGKLETYSRKLTQGSAQLRLHEDDKVYSLSCSAELKDDEVLRTRCGFAGAVTISIYDGTGKVSRIVTFKDGLIQKEAAGDSTYARGSEVAYKNGKKQGEERVLDKGGKLKVSITWAEDVKDGKELHYADDGKKVVSELLWKKGELQQLTERYLNGNTKLQMIHETPRKLQRRMYWDTGKLSGEGTLVLAASARPGLDYRGKAWLEEGVHKTYFESGLLESETSFHEGKRQGARKTWWENGKPQVVEEYVEDRRTKARSWDKDGKLVLDEEYEADGSRKLKR